MVAKKLLILGNGFDRAHILKQTDRSLPTRYSDFLQNVCHRLSYKFSKRNAFDQLFEEEDERNIRQLIEKNDKKKLNNKEELYEEVNNFVEKNGNIWIDIFHRIDARSKFQWINCEEEIARVGKVLSFMIEKQQVPKGEEVYLERVLPEYASYVHGNNDVEEKIWRLQRDLQYLIILLEEYFFKHIETLRKEDIKYFPEKICKLEDVDEIVTYNYTHLYKYYPNLQNANVHHIHGEVGKTNLVFGYEDSKNDKFCRGLESLKKYFQMEKYGLKFNIQDIFKNENNWNVIVFGYSLGKTDKESLTKLLDNTFVNKIIVYYYKDKNPLLENLNEIFEKETIKKWRLEDKKIQFRVC